MNILGSVFSSFHLFSVVLGDRIGVITIFDNPVVLLYIGDGSVVSVYNKIAHLFLLKIWMETMTKRLLYIWMLSLAICSLAAIGQPRYRTFTQDQLSERQNLSAGRSVASRVSFVVKNTLKQPMNVLSAHLSSPIVALEDSGGFPSVKLMNSRTTVVASGKTLQPGDSVILQALVKRTVRGTTITGYQLRNVVTPSQSKIKNEALSPGVGVITMSINYGNPIMLVRAATDQQIVAPPTGGNIRDYLYRLDIRKPAGIVLGVAKAPGKVGWIRSFRSDIQSFPQTGTPRCFDTILVSTKKKPFVGELKNPTVRVYNNHLLGSLFALKLAMIANDSGITEPYGPDVTPLRLLVYYDSTNPGNRFNNLTIQQICNLTDTALTYCGKYTSSDFAEFDQCLSGIITAFSGPLSVSSMSPLKVQGTNSLVTAPFLHQNPAAIPALPRLKTVASLEPEQNALALNYPNPFNPTTTLTFSLKENSTVSLKVYNLLGQEVATLLDHSEMDGGQHAVQFEANNLPSGTYYYRILATNVTTGEVFSDVKKMTLMK